MKEDIHQHDKRLATIKKNVENDKELSPKNKELMLNFDRIIAIQGLSYSRRYKYQYMLRVIAKKINKDFDKITKEDLMNYIEKLNSTKYSEWTKASFKEILKRFMKWVKGFEGKREYPPEVDWLRTKNCKNFKQLPNEGDLLNEEEIKLMIEKTTNFRDKALISMLWESGARIGEIATLRIKDIIFDKYGAQINVEGKTGARKIRLISSVPQISQWLSVHQNKNDRESYVFILLQHKSLKRYRYAIIRKTLVEIAKRAGIQKRVNPHSFRHARATFLANHMTEFQMNQYFGWVQGSRVASTYVHLSGKNTESTLLKLNGIIAEEQQKPSVLQPKICQRCGTINSYDNKFCCKCGGVLDLKTAMEMDEELKMQNETRSKSDSVLNELFKDPEIVSIIMRKMKELEMHKIGFNIVDTAKMI